MSAKAVGFVTAIGNSSSDPFNIGQVVVNFMVSSDTGASGPFNGQVVLSYDMMQNDAQINLEIRTALANYLNPLFTPNPNMSANDIRGCAI